MQAKTLHKELAVLVGDDDAWTLLSWETGVSVPRLKLMDAEVATPDFLCEAAQKRADGMPLAYAYGMAPFHGRMFHVTPAVLIPRQETEELVEHALQFAEDDVVLIDCGTGSGCIPITCALEGEWRTVRACDVSLDALEIAQQNAEELEAPVGFELQDVTSERWVRWVKEVVGESPCVMTANLPYIPTRGIGELDKGVEYEPRLALDGGEHGTEIIKKWLARVRETGLDARLLLELDADNYDDLNAYCEAEGWDITWRRDAAGLLRFCDIASRAQTHG